MLTALLSLQGFALSQAATFTVTPSAKAVNIGDVVTVTVSATTNYYAAATAVPVYYDDTVFDFVPDSVTATGIFGENEATRIYQESQSGMLYVALVPNSLADASAQILENTVLFSFQLKAKAYGVCEVGLHAEDQKTESNKAGILYCGAFASEDVASDVTAIGQVFTLQNTQVEISDAVKPKLILSELGETNGAAIATTTMYDGYAGVVFGIEAYSMDDILANLATKAGSIEIVANEEGCDYGTGAVINLLDTNGTVVASYLYILFGDVDGNGFADSVDSGVIGEAEYGLSEFAYPYYELAADFDGNGYFDSVDAGCVGEAEYGLYETTQADIAAEVLNNYSF